jgi:hypothetical protein
MRSLARVAVALLGLASFPAVIWAFFHLLPLVADVFVLRRAAAYVPAVFEVEWARFDEVTPVAVGTINGRRETMSLNDVLPRRPTGLNDLQDLMADKARMDVLYDAQGTRTAFEGRRLRVLPRTPDLPEESSRRVVRTALVGYGPALLLLGLGFLISRLWARRMGMWLYPAFFFLAIQPLFVLFLVVLEFAQ